MYENDSFFTLSMVEQVGLVVISLCLAGATLWLFYKIGKRMRITSRVVTSLLFFWAFIWLSPQVYYLYYLLLFDYLDYQNVIQAAPNVHEIISILTFNDNANLSFHSKAIFGWMLIAMAFLMNWQDKR